MQLIKRRNYFYKKARKSGSDEDFQKFKQLRNKVVTELKLAKRAFFLDLQTQHPNMFWKKLSLLNSKECTVPTLTKGNVVACTNTEKANLLNVSFMDIFNTATPELSKDDIPEAPLDNCPSELLCTEEKVYNLLSTLDVSKSNGHDDISTRMLKETALSMTSVVTQLFNISIRLGEIPDEWKVARISPIPKSGKPSDPANYRPISLLSVLSKLLEKHVRDLLLDHLQSFCPLSAQQWGFTQGKSTIGALLAATDHWHNALDSGLEICTVFFDYSKAFDTVPHRCLLHKLKSANIHPHILRWIAYYLYGRSQYVCVGGSSSDLQPVLSGVPQGSVLGPILFIFYINDITNIQLTAGTMSLYADDMMLYRVIRSASDYQALQIDIDNLCCWTNNNHLTFNANKCDCIKKKETNSPQFPNHD